MKELNEAALVTPYRVLHVLATFDKDGKSYPSVGTIGHLIRKDVRTVRRSLRILESLGYIKRLPELSEHSTHVYQLSRDKVSQPRTQMSAPDTDVRQVFNPICFFSFENFLLKSGFAKGRTAAARDQQGGLGEGRKTAKHQTSDSHQTREDPHQALPLPPQSQEPQLLPDAAKLWELYAGLPELPIRPQLTKGRIKMLNARVAAFPLEKLEHAVVALVDWHIPNGHSRIERALSKAKVDESHAERIEMMARKGKVIAKSRKVPGRVMNYADFVANLSSAEVANVNNALSSIDAFIKNQASPSPGVRARATKSAEWLKDKHGVKAKVDPQTNMCNKLLVL
jgi:hypothetical protein